MKKTNFTNSFPVGREGVIRPLGFIVTCLALFLLLVSQSLLAQQRPADLGEEVTHSVTQAIASEAAFLENEVKTPNGADTEYNWAMINYYSAVLDAFSNNEDISAAFLAKTGDLSLTGGNHQGASVALTPNGNTDTFFTEAEFKQFQVLVDQMDLLDGNLSDLTALFNYLRTIKNS